MVVRLFDLEVFISLLQRLGKYSRTSYTVILTCVLPSLMIHMTCTDEYPSEFKWLVSKLKGEASGLLLTSSNL